MSAGSAESSSTVSGSASASAAAASTVPVPEDGSFPTVPIVAGLVGSVLVFGGVFAFYYLRERRRRIVRNAAAGNMRQI